MNTRKIAAISLVISSVSAACGLLLPLFSMSAADVGIIGGASYPTYLYGLFNSCGGVGAALFTLGVAVTIMCIFVMIFPKTIEQHCTAAATLLSGAFGISVGGGMYCFAQLLVISAFHEYSRHPLSYPASIIAGIAFFGICVITAIIYIVKRAAKPTLKGVLADIAVSVILLVPSFFIWSSIHNLLSYAVSMI